MYVYIVEKCEEDSHNSYWVTKSVCPTQQAAEKALERVWQEEATRFFCRPPLPPGKHIKTRLDGSTYEASDDWWRSYFRIQAYEVEGEDG